MMSDVSSFYFEWPLTLLGLFFIPLFWILYLRYQRKLWRDAVRFSYAAVVEHLQQKPAGWKRLLIPICISLILACLIFSLARPTLVAQVPTRSVNMMLVMDISLSMLADDIRPDRITAAKEAGIDFVNSMPKDVRIGLELFAGNNYVMSPPTSRHSEIAAYLKNLRKEDLKIRTEIGTALQTALKILSAEEAARLKKNPNDKKKPDQIIVLLSDGDSHEGYPWDLAAQDAKKQHVTIHTIAVGKEESTSIVYNGTELPVLFSEATLRRIAEIAEGQFFRVTDRDDFRKIYDQIRRRSVHYEERAVDIGFCFSGLALLVLTTGLLAISRFIRPLW